MRNQTATMAAPMRPAMMPSRRYLDRESMRTLLSIEWGRGLSLLLSVYHPREVTASERDATQCLRRANAGGSGGPPDSPPTPIPGRVASARMPSEANPTSRSARRSAGRLRRARRPAQQGGERPPSRGMGGQAEAPERGGARGEEVERTTAPACPGPLHGVNRTPLHGNALRRIGALLTQELLDL